MTSAFSWQNSIRLCPASFCTPRPKFACYFRYFLPSYFCIPVPYNEKNIFFVAISLEWLLTKTKLTKVDKDVEKLEPLFTVGGIEKCCNCYGDQDDSFSKTSKLWDLPSGPVVKNLLCNAGDTGSKNDPSC